MSETSSAPRPSLRAFWRDLSPAGRWLLSTTAIQTLGRGLTLPFTIIYLNEVRASRSTSPAPRWRSSPWSRSPSPALAARSPAGSAHDGCC